MKNYAMYILDTETTNLDSYVGDVIELSIHRMKDDTIKTWFIKPVNFDGIDPVALKINGHLIEDITWKTQHGRDTYKESKDVIVDVENWLAEDDLPTENRILIAHNAAFDKAHLQQLWSKAKSSETFPFGRRMIDTSSLEFFMDLCSPDEEMAQGYSLANLCKKYKVTNSKAHSAEADTTALTECFKKQIAFFKKALA